MMPEEKFDENNATELHDGGVSGGLVVRADQWDNAALELVCGIANAGGGHLLVKVSSLDYGSGHRRIKKNLDSISGSIFTRLGLRCAVAPVMEGGDFLLEVEVPSAAEPASLDGVCWMFVDGHNVRRTPEEIFRAWQDDSSSSWELRALPYVDYDDLSTDALLDVAATPLGDPQNSDVMLTDPIAEKLEQLGLTHPRTHKLNNAGGVLLCVNPARFIPGASLRIVSFDSNGTPTGEQDEVIGPLAYQINRSVQLIAEKYLPSISMEKSFLRACPPESALREAVANALVHKDYSPGVPVRVMVSPGHIIVQNVGAVPEGWTEETLREPHAPHFRNPLLATTSQKLGIVPGWGNGIEKMIADCALAGAHTPRFDLEAERTEVWFPLPSALNESEKKRSANKKSEKKRETPPSQGRAQTPRMTFAERSVAAARKLDLTQTDEHVLQILTTNGRATGARIAQALGVSERTVRRSFKKLRELELIERIGSDKAGYWIVTE